MKKVFSYHTFMFPFLWDQCDEKKRGLNICEVFDNDFDGNIWERTSSSSYGIIENCIDLSDANNTENRMYYCAYQFFNEEGRKLIFDESEGSIIREFCIKKEYISDAQYVINSAESVAELDIIAIHLRIFNTGIAMFSIDCENVDYPSLKDVKWINEYGRRVSLSFWPQEPNSYKKCASSLCIRNKKSGNVICKDDIDSFIRERSCEVSLTYISNLIRDLLDRNGNNIHFSAKKKVGDHIIQIRPILDGKMYVSCCIADKEVQIQLVEGYDETSNSFSEEVMETLLELINVDLEGTCVYKNKKEAQEYLENHLCLTEFSGDSPKLLSITEQSCIKIIVPQEDMKDQDYEVDYHINIYNRIILVGLVQRMAIANFQQEIARISYGIEDAKKKMNNNHVLKIMELQERYVAFQSQFLLFEMTAQREGTYIYNKIQEVLHIEEENETLSNRLSGLYELANINQGYAFNKWALILSLIALVSASFAAVNDADTLGRFTVGNYSGYVVLALELVICTCIVYYIMNKKYK